MRQSRVDRVMQSDRNSLCRDFVLDSVNKAFRDEDNNDQINKKQSNEENAYYNTTTRNS